MANTIKKILDIVTTVIIAIIGVLAVAYIALMVLGFRGYTVLSPSMEPTYKTGSVIYVKQVATNELKVGDPITFRSGNAIVTHRIVKLEQIDGTTVYRTQGDANENIDGSPVYPQNVIGMPVFSVPYLGYALSYIQQPPGMYVAIAVGAALVLLVFLPGLIFDKAKPEQGKVAEEDSAEGPPPEEEPEEGNMNQ